MRSLPKCLWFLLFAAAALPAQAEMQGGLWNLTVTMKVDGSAKPFGPYSQSQCFTQADLQDPGKLFAEGDNAVCEYVNKRYYANQITFNIRCGGGIPLGGTGEVEFGRDAFEGHMDLGANAEGGPTVETHSQVSGKRAGPCQE